MIQTEYDYNQSSGSGTGMQNSGGTDYQTQYQPTQYEPQPSQSTIYYRPPSPIPQAQPQPQLQPENPPPQPNPVVITQPKPQFQFFNQTFECRYMGRNGCKGLWGQKNIRGPVDQMTANAKHLASINDLQRVRVTISESGVLIEPSLDQNTRLKGQAKK